MMFCVPLLVYEADNPNKIIIVFIVFFSIAVIFSLLRGRKKLIGRKRYKDKLIPELWYYSKLIDIELGQINQTQPTLQKTFYTFLEKKFNINGICKKNIHQIIEEHSSTNRFAAYYEKLNTEIEMLKHKSNKKVIEYVTSSKLEFIKKIEMTDNHDEDDCNNC